VQRSDCRVASTPELCTRRHSEINVRARACACAGQRGGRTRMHYRCGFSIDHFDHSLSCGPMRPARPNGDIRRGLEAHCAFNRSVIMTNGRARRAEKLTWDSLTIRFDSIHRAFRRAPVPVSNRASWRPSPNSFICSADVRRQRWRSCAAVPIYKLQNLAGYMTG